MKQQRSRDKKEVMAQAAARLLIEEGPAAITHRNVADHAGLAPGSGNYYFPSKAELYRTAVSRAEDYRAEQAMLLAQQVQPAADPKELALALLNVLYAPKLTADVVGIRLIPMLDAHKDPELQSIMRAHAPLLRSAVQQAVFAGAGQKIDDDCAELVSMSLSSALLYGQAIGAEDPIDYAADRIGALLGHLGLTSALRRA